MATNTARMGRVKRDHTRTHAARQATLALRVARTVRTATTPLDTAALEAELHAAQVRATDYGTGAMAAYYR